MKSIKSLIVAGSAALALGTLQAKAQSFPTLPFPLASQYQFEQLNFNLTVTTQALLYTNSIGNTNVVISTVKAEKITTQTILKFLATDLNANWPAGAKLAYDFQSGDVFVVDKTGAIPLFDLSADADHLGTNVLSVFGIQIQASDCIVVAGRQNPLGRILNSQTTFAPVLLQIDTMTLDGTEDIYLNLSGNDTSVFSATAKTATQTDDMPVSGYGWNGNSIISVTGRITGFGSWKAASGPSGTLEDSFPVGASPILVP